MSKKSTKLLIKENKFFQPLDPKALGIAWGVVCGICLFALSMASQYGYGNPIMAFLIELLPGYSQSFAGAVFGFALGLVAGFVILYFVALAYNFFVEK